MSGERGRKSSRAPAPNEDDESGPRPVVSSGGLRAELDKVLEDILQPLLTADGGGLEVVAFQDQPPAVELRLTGAFRGDPSATYVRDRVIAPALRKALGPKLVVRWAIG